MMGPIHSEKKRQTEGSNHFYLFYLIIYAKKKIEITPCNFIAFNLINSSNGAIHNFA